MGVAAFGQSYRVQGEEGYTKPKYMVFQSVGSDYANVYNHFLNAFQRAGFDVMRSEWVNAQIAQEKHRRAVAEVLQANEGSEFEEDALREALKERGLLNGWKNTVEKLTLAGLVSKRTEVSTDTRFKKEVALFSWVEGSPLPELTWATQNTLHILSFNYTYRESLSCGTTLSEIHGTIRDISGDLNEQVIDFTFDQPMLSSDCPKEIVNNLVRRITSDMREETVKSRASAPSDVSFSVKGDGEEINLVQTLLTVAKPGADCNGMEAIHFEDDFALGLLESYDVIDRSVTQQILDEHKLNLSGLFSESDFLEAGQFAGAEAILTIQPSCLNETNILKVKMISVNSSLLLWTSIAKNPDRSVQASEVLDVIDRELSDR